MQPAQYRDCGRVKPDCICPKSSITYVSQINRAAMPAPAATFAMERPIISSRLPSFIGRQWRPPDSALTGCLAEAMRPSNKVRSIHATDSTLAIHDAPSPSADPTNGHRRWNSGVGHSGEVAFAMGAVGAGWLVAIGPAAAIKKDPAEGRVLAHRRVPVVPRRLAAAPRNSREPQEVGEAGA